MKKFACMKCGDRCCNFKSEEEMPLVFPWELRKLKSIDENLVFKPYLAYRAGDLHLVVLYRWIVAGKCRFLAEDRECKIHSDKPISCKMYPLIVGLSDNTLRVSAACKYVEENRDLLNADRIDAVFEHEYFYALRSYVLLKVLEELARAQGWEQVVLSEGLSPRKHVDIDEYVNVSTLLAGIDRSLAKHSEEPP